MTILWETYCKNVALTTILPKKIKANFLGQRILESGRGTTRQATELLNFGGMLNKPELAALCHGFRTIDRYDYPVFWTIEEEIRYFWALVHRKAFYPDTDKHLEDGNDFIDYIGRHGYCPPGYPGSPVHDKWVRDTGFQTYTDYIRSLVPEARIQLAKYGLVDEEVPMPIPIPALVPLPVPPVVVPIDNPLSVVNGMLLGPNVHRRLVAGHDHFKRYQTIGILLHGTGCHAGTSRIIVDGLHSPGILDAWDDPSQGKSAHILNTRDENIWHAVDLTLPAWGCYGWNNKLIHIENENFGPCNPWKEILGYFYRYAGTLWWQRMAKSEMRLVAGQYVEDYLVGQVVNTVREIAAIRAAFPGPIWVKGHSEMPPPIETWDPGSWWPWANIQR